ncbi:MAG: hypothetical protein ACLUBM_01700 [Collinsella sp.]
MFNAVVHALLALAPELDAAKVEDVPMSLKAWIDGSQGNIRRETLGAKCMCVTSLQISYMASRTVGNMQN